MRIFGTYTTRTFQPHCSAQFIRSVRRFCYFPVLYWGITRSVDSIEVTNLWMNFLILFWKLCAQCRFGSVSGAGEGGRSADAYLARRVKFLRCKMNDTNNNSKNVGSGEDPRSVVPRCRRCDRNGGRGREIRVQMTEKSFPVQWWKTRQVVKTLTGIKRRRDCARVRDNITYRSSIRLAFCHVPTSEECTYEIHITLRKMWN